MSKKYDAELKKQVAYLDLMWRAGGTNEAIQRMQEHEAYLKQHGSHVEIDAYNLWLMGTRSIERAGRF